MGALGVILLVFAGWNVMMLFLYPMAEGQEIKSTRRPADTVIASLGSVFKAVVFILAALAIWGVLG